MEEKITLSLRQELGTGIKEYLEDLGRRLPGGTFKWSDSYGREALTLLLLYHEFITKPELSSKEATDQLKVLLRQTSNQAARFVPRSVYAYLRARARSQS